MFCLFNDRKRSVAPNPPKKNGSFFAILFFFTLMFGAIVTLMLVSASHEEGAASRSKRTPSKFAIDFCSMGVGGREGGGVTNVCGCLRCYYDKTV